MTFQKKNLFLYQESHCTWIPIQAVTIWRCGLVESNGRWWKWKAVLHLSFVLFLLLFQLVYSFKFLILDDLIKSMKKYILACILKKYKKGDPKFIYLLKKTNLSTLKLEK